MRSVSGVTCSGSRSRRVTAIRPPSSAGGYHHHIGLNTWESLGGTPPPPGHTGLYHVAVRYPDRASLADALRACWRPGSQLDGASDHGVSEALYLRDPDGNGVELYRDRPHEEWPTTTDGELAMTTRPLDVQRCSPRRRRAPFAPVVSLAASEDNGPSVRLVGREPIQAVARGSAGRAASMRGEGGPPAPFYRGLDSDRAEARSSGSTG